MVLDNVFTVASEWDLVTWVVGQVREVMRRRRRDRFFFLKALGEEKLAEAYKGCDIPISFPEGEALLIHPLQALFRGDLDLATLTEGCTPGTVHQRLADALKEHIKHHTTGSRIIASERAPTLSCTVRIRWFRDPQRPKNKYSWLLLDFRQYDDVPPTAIEQIAHIPALDDSSEEARTSWEATYGQAAREAQAWQRRLYAVRKKCTIAVWSDHALGPQKLLRNKQVFKAYREVRKCRLASGDDTHHWKWLYAHPQLSDDDMIVLVLLYLLQERMLELMPERFQFLQRYFQRFRWATQVGEADLCEHMLRNFVLPEDWRTMATYLKEVLRGKRATEARKAAETAREQPVVSLEKVEANLAKKHQGYASKPQHPRFVFGDGPPPQFFSVDDAVRRIQAAGSQRAPGRATVYNWITKGHRWYGKIDAIGDAREGYQVTEQGLAQLDRIVQAQERCEKLRKSPGMTPANLKKLYQRYKKPEGPPDLDAIEIHVARRSRKEDQEPLEDSLSLEEKVAACDELLERLPPLSKKWEDVQEEREQLRQRLRGSHP
jgi:hypothetical protein